MKKNNFIKSLSSVLLIVFIGKILGLLKQIFFASYFGASTNTDIFFTSYFFVYEMSTAFFVSLSTAFLKSYGESKKKNPKITNSLFTNVVIYFSLLAIIITILLLIFTKPIIKIIAPGYINNSSLILYIRILSSIITLFCIQSICNSILDYEKKFIYGKLLSVILNSMLIVFTILLANKIGIISLFVAVVLSYLIQTLISVFAVKKFVCFSISSFLTNNNEQFINLLKIFFPLFIGCAITEINSIVDRSIASSLGSGSVSYITYGASINEIVTVLLIGTTVSVFYSYSASMVIENETDRLKKYFILIAKYMIIFLLPLNIIFYFCSTDIIKLFYMRGSFDVISVKNTSAVILGYSFGFIPLLIRSLLLKLHYSYNDSKNPMYNGIVTMLINIVLSYILSIKMGVIGIPVATSISSLVSMLLSLYTIKKHINLFSNINIKVFIFKIICSTLPVILIVLFLVDNIVFLPVFNIVIISISVVVLFVIFAIMNKLIDINELKKEIRKK